MNPSLAKNINAFGVLGLCGILLGAYYVQFANGELPCPLCLLQRLAVIGVAFGAMLNLRYGIHPKHYAISLLSAIFGACVSARQILLHIAPGSDGYGSPVLGMHLYTWAFVVFVVTITLIGLMLLSEQQYGEYDEQKDTRDLDNFVQIVFFLVLIITAANVVTTYLECGLKQCPANPTSYIILDK